MRAWTVKAANHSITRIPLQIQGRDQNAGIFEAAAAFGTALAL